MERIPASAARLGQIRSGAVVVGATPAVFAIHGPGAEQCLQGLLTNDVVKAGPDSLGYGALLTPKGMIVVDYWVVRQSERFLLVADRLGHQPSRDGFRRQLPPRLARVTDLTDEWTTLAVLGEKARGAVVTALGCDPPAGRAALISESVVITAPGSPRAPFRYLVVGPRGELAEIAARLGASGAEPGTGRDVRAARVLAGFPTLGVEIDDKTLPQEVDFDGIGGVSHTKGCYVGQETVARLHFRGHSNWLLRGVALDQGGDSVTEVIHQDGKPVVRLGTVLDLGNGSAIGLAKVRRELAPGAVIQLADGGGSLRILELPFGDR
jgi:folate-binding protein YgfZ